MAGHSEPIVVTLPSGRRVDATVRGHTVHTDQPLDGGGEDVAPSPFELFLASLATCAGIFVQGFCAKRQLSTENIRLVQHADFHPDGGLKGARLQIELPPTFPEKYHDALIRTVEQCSVKRAIAAQPTFEVVVKS